MKVKIKSLVPVFSLIALIGCKSFPIESPNPTKGEFKVMILYSNGEGKTFDMAYYEKKHMPMVAGFLGDNLVSYEIDKGLSGRTPDEKVPFLAIGYFYVNSIEQYNMAIGQHRDAIVDDFKNYTNVLPLIQISEIQLLSPPLGKDQ